MSNPNPIEKKIKAMQSDINACEGEPCDGPCGKKMKKGDSVYLIADAKIGVRYVCRECAVVHVKEGERVDA